MTSEQSAYLKHLEYELRMLLGARNICDLFEKADMGNTLNYVKDSVYVHTRNLYAFFSAKSKDELTILDFETRSLANKLKPRHYGEWGKSMNTHVMHLRKARLKPSNQHQQHLNEQIQNYANDIEALWKKWIELTTEEELAKALQKSLASALREAKHDFIRTKNRLN